MANPEHVEIVKQGAEAIAVWRSANSQTRFDLIGADLHKASLSGADLRVANVSMADLSGADLDEANLSGASLREADLTQTSLRGANLHSTTLVKTRLRWSDLSGAHLRRANMEGADLSNANLIEANLSRTSLYAANLHGAQLSATNLRGADLRMANLRTAALWSTDLSFTDLSATHGLGEARHNGPSDIGIQTIVNSNGKIPEVFLRGCGVPDEWITQIPAIIGSMQPIQFYSCFISYSHENKSFAQRLYEALQARGIRCWLDEHQLLPGDDAHEQIDRGIRLWDKVLLCASKASLTSWWVDKEIATAFKKEQQLMKERGKKTLALIPLDLDGFLFSDECHNPKATEVQERIAAKFKGWDKDNALFEQEFERLIKALKPNDTGREKPPPPML